MSIEHEQFSKNILKTVLGKCFKGNIEILRHDKSYVVPLGDNYMCEVLRIVVKFSINHGKNIQTMSMITKCPMESDIMIGIEKEINFYNCELSIYGTILPILEKLEYKKKVGPKAYYLSNKIERIIILEDLSTLHYKMAKRLEGLDLKHCILAVEKLAYFHAASVVLYEKNPKIMDQYNKGLCYRAHYIETYISIGFQETIKACQRIPNLQKYSTKIKENLVDKFFTSGEHDPDFNVLNHGDFWVNNMMFQYDKEGTLEDVVFIDFQLCVFGSPLYDLHYFLATSLQPEVIKNHITTIVDKYYNALFRNLTVLEAKAKIPTRKDFEKSFVEKAYIGFGSLCLALPSIKASMATNTDMITDDAFRRHCFTNTNFIHSFQHLIPFYDSLGVFDF